jgi:hypothetical protein
MRKKVDTGKGSTTLPGVAVAHRVDTSPLVITLTLKGRKAALVRRLARYESRTPVGYARSALQSFVDCDVQTRRAEGDPEVSLLANQRSRPR